MAILAEGLVSRVPTEKGLHGVFPPDQLARRHPQHAHCNSGPHEQPAHCGGPVSPAVGPMPQTVPSSSARCMAAFLSTRPPEHGAVATVSQPTPSSPRRVASSPVRSSSRSFGSARAEPDGTVGCGAFPRTEASGSRNLPGDTPLGRGLGPAAAGEGPHAHGASAAANSGAFPTPGAAEVSQPFSVNLAHRRRGGAPTAEGAGPRSGSKNSRRSGSTNNVELEEWPTSWPGRPGLMYLGPGRTIEDATWRWSRPGGACLDFPFREPGCVTRAIVLVAHRVLPEQPLRAGESG